MQNLLNQDTTPHGHSAPLNPLSESADTYPQKPSPVENQKQPGTLKLIISMLIFGAFYYFFFSRDWQVIAWLVAIVFIHELGHYFAMKIFHYKDLSIFFIPLIGAVAGGSKEKISQKEKAIVLLAGPVPGIVIGLILFYLSGYYSDYFLLRLSYAFVVLNLLNLLPVYPLDGGQLLKTLFLESRQLISTIFIIASIALIAGYAIFYQEWFVLIIPYFLVTRMIQQNRINKLRNSLQDRKITYDKSYDELSNEEYWRIRDEIAAENLLPGTGILAGERVADEKESDVIQYIKLVLAPKPVKDLSPAGITLFIMVWISSFALPAIIMKESI